MALRPYQEEFVRKAQIALIEFDRVLGVSPTGSGKTIIAGELCKRWRGRILFLADAKELVFQGAGKIASWTEEFIGVEMAKMKVNPADNERIVVATTQSIANRLDKYPEDHFSLIIIDEAHRNTLGALAQRVLTHFKDSKVVGITATPYRSDKRELGDYYETISHEIGLADLIKQGFLSRITVKSVPLGISLDKVRTTAGDYNDRDLGEAIEPYLKASAQLLFDHARDRKTVVFLPLIKTSKAFVSACRELGLKAVHVDGTDREDLELFKRDEARIICNASLLTTGWDQPDVDCVLVLRPTKSFTLFSQMVGRGTRICEGKKDLLLLDPMFLTDTQTLIRPARLMASSEDQARGVQAILDEVGEDGETDVEDLLDAIDEEEDLRSSRLEEELKKNAKKKARTVDYLEFALKLHDNDLLDYEPTMKWEGQPPSSGQIAILQKNGFDVEAITSKGLASKILDTIFKRRELNLATPKQVKWLTKFKHPETHTATFEEASKFLDSKFGKNK